MEILGYTLMGVLLLAIVWAGLRSNLLRDQINDPRAFLEAEKKKKRFGAFRREKGEIPRPFSLARTQMTLWIAVVLSTYIWVYFCGPNAGAHIAIDPTALVLLGISGGTAVAGIAIDTDQQGRFRHQNQPSDNFLTDILSDADGLSIGRLQHFAWSIISMAVYLSQVGSLGAGRLPVLDSALLGLMGLSSGTYLALKAGENTGNGASIAMANSMLAAASSPPEGKRPVVVPPFGKGAQKQPV